MAPLNGRSWPKADHRERLESTQLGHSRGFEINGCLRTETVIRRDLAQGPLIDRKAVVQTTFLKPPVLNIPIRKNLMIVIRESIDMNNEVRWIKFKPVVAGAQIATLVDQVSDNTMHLVSIFPQREL